MNQGWQSEATDGLKGAWSLSFFLSLSDYQPTYLPIYLSMYLSIYLSVYLSIHPSIYLSFCQAIHISIYLFPLPSWLCARRFSESTFSRICIFSLLTLSLLFFSLLIFLFSLPLPCFPLTRLPQFFTWQLQTQKKSRKKSARLKVTTSRTNDFCETSSKNGKISAALTPSCQFVLRFFCSTSLKYCACHENWLPGHTKCGSYHAKSS